jgi:uncharacterized protein (UPF0332 family)
MLYTAKALLSERDLSAHQPSGVHTLFGEHFAETGVMDAKFHRFLLDSFDRRLEGDYGLAVALDPAEAAAMIQQTQEFLAAARALLK